jgi:5'-nucleotidase
MRILLTNDDGVQSPVLHRAAEALSAEHEVVVVAPSHDQSGRSHAFTHGPDKLLTHAAEAGHSWPGLVYRVDGTPADCVKFAVAHLLKDRLPDLVVSGPNVGENAGVSAVYSGTVAAAREAALWNIPGLAVSLAHLEGEFGDPASTMRERRARLDFALDWILALLRAGAEDAALLPAPGALWNVNFPARAPDEVVGTRFTRMGSAMFDDHYVEGVTAHGLPGHKLEGRKPVERFEPGTDDHALRQGYVAVAPLRVSQADEAALAALGAREDALDARLDAQRRAAAAKNAPDFQTPAATANRPA